MVSVLETIEAIRSGLMWIGLSALAAIAVGVVGAWLCRGVASAMRRPLAVARLAAFVAFSAFCVIRGGAKFLMPSPSTGGTPVVPVMQSPTAGGTPVAPVVVTPEDIARGHCLESVTTNDAVSYAMPTNGVEYMPWSLGGGYEMHFPLDLGDDFEFPFGTGVVRRLDVLSGGTVESLPRQRVDGAYYSLMSICAAREYASIVPGVGRFWWADAAGTAGLEALPYRMKLLTWENVYGERDRTGQYSAQIELWDDGNFTTRSNNVESVYRRVLPFDLDNDGLPNDIDPAPETPLVPSARNQSEAWAEAAFPSNAAEIAAMGGYAAWAAARGADLDRRLVSLGITFDDGSAWPALLDFGGVPVVADGGAELSFAIGCGAKVPFSLTAGRLGSVSVTATEPPMRSGEGGTTTTDSRAFQNISSYPYECSVGGVTVHLDDPRTGWLRRIAVVSVEPTWLPHFFPDDTAGLEAIVSDCHSNAYLGCTWHGGEGITFSQEHSQQLLSLVANYTAHDCLKLYFVGEIISERMRVKAMHTPFGIVVGRRVTRNTLAHEMGHALGLDDCYAFSALKNGGFVYLPYALECVDAATFLHEPGDWGEESGRGFYEMSDTRMSVLMRMLMHGISVRPDSRCDIPADYVMSLKRDATTQQHVFRRVGERAIQPENQEVYSR